MNVRDHLIEGAALPHLPLYRLCLGRERRALALRPGGPAARASAHLVLGRGGAKLCSSPRSTSKPGTPAKAAGPGIRASTAALSGSKSPTRGASSDRVGHCGPGTGPRSRTARPSARAISTRTRPLTDTPTPPSSSNGPSTSPAVSPRPTSSRTFWGTRTSRREENPIPLPPFRSKKSARPFWTGRRRLILPFRSKNSARSRLRPSTSG